MDNTACRALIMHMRGNVPRARATQNITSRSIRPHEVCGACVHPGCSAMKLKALKLFSGKLSRHAGQR